MNFNTRDSTGGKNFNGSSDNFQFSANSGENKSADTLEAGNHAVGGGGAAGRAANNRSSDNFSVNTGATSKGPPKKIKQENPMSMITTQALLYACAYFLTGMFSTMNACHFGYFCHHPFFALFGLG